MHYTATYHPRYYNTYSTTSTEWKTLTREDIIIDIETEKPIEKPLKDVSKDSFFEILGG